MSWIWSNLDLIGELALRHVLIAAPAILLSLLIAVPVARLANASRIGRRLLLGGSGVVYAIPSLAVFVILPGLIGTRILDPLNVVIALTLYGAALLVRSASEAFDAVDGDLLTAARAQGHSPWQLFWRVELPQAGESILAGLRVVSASTLSLVSVGALIGVQSLGSLFTEGYARAFLAEIGAGIVGTVILAVAVDALLVGLAALLMPWTRRARRAPAEDRARSGPAAALALGGDPATAPADASATTGGAR
ncbi:ABC transporter permease subunit [Micrococcus sp. M4NT]|uniref:ABC transporter permease n=1 Tax=Micrococcus sp. M4NT TaxID=2957501 RepID=UPI0029B9C9EC|nr:ABC transporter permease subunit [Micrococcus sp. M4NT]MDX2342026.1 ABC transporter permease subunit [Micrococcus sp. M4NT]